MFGAFGRRAAWLLVLFSGVSGCLGDGLASQGADDVIDAPQVADDGSPGVRPLTPVQMTALGDLQRDTGTRWQMTVGGEGGIFLSGREAPPLALSVSDPSARGMAFIQQRAALFQLSDAYAELAPVDVRADALGFQHARFAQHVDGIPVFGSGLSVHFDREGAIVAVSGRHLTGAPSVRTRPEVNRERALASARSVLSRERPDVRRGDIGFEGADLVIHAVGGRGSVGGAPRLTWLVTFSVEGADVPAVMRYFVDAETGAVVDAFNDLHTVAASGVGVKGDVKGFDVAPADGIYQLGARSINPNGIWTYTANEGQTPVPLTSTNLSAWDTGVYGAGAGVDAFVHQGATYKYYLNHHGRRGIDDNRDFLVQKSIVHVGKRWNNAAWQPIQKQMIFGDGDGVLFIPLTALDVVAHELTHGVTSYESGLIYQNQSGALNEATSDILAVFMEHSEVGNPAFGRAANWLLGEDIMAPGAGAALRDLAHPAARGQPDHMSKFRNLPNTAEGDWGGVHINSGIFNNAVYLYTNGGTNDVSGRSVSGIGVAKGEKIYYLASTQYYQSGTDFASGAQANLQATQSLYGKPSLEYGAVRLGFEATGILPICTISCAGKACGSDDGCGGICQAGSGCQSSCAPACQGKICGSADGCGGVCQTGSGCTAACLPRCAGKVCGASNECGGTCQQGSGCSTNGCVPDCASKVCGAPDGCGSFCNAGPSCGNGCVPQCVNVACGVPDGCGGLCQQGGGCGEPNSPAVALVSFPADGVGRGGEILVSVNVVGEVRSARIVWTSPFSRRVFEMSYDEEGRYRVKGVVGDPGIRRFEVIVEDSAGRRATTGIHHFEVGD
jgi:Zn-dependent metalloprotease